LQSWLTKHKGFRVGTDEDCECDDDIASTRRGSGGAWAPNPNFHPYYAVGDFNSDGQPDFAVVLIGAAEKKYVAIFNGPFSQNSASSPAYLDHKHVGALFFGAPRPKPWRLLVGPFESEGTLFKPRGALYVAIPSHCC
jgi:hypothetical protein